MAGLLGFSRYNSRYNQETLMSMKDLMLHRHYYLSDPIFEDEHICAARVHKAIQQPHKQPHIKNNIYVWFNGELFNRPERYATDSEFIATLYHSTDSFKFIEQCNGVFCAVIYDKNKKMIYLISDRYGLKPLYYSFSNNHFSWSSEVKCIACAPWFTRTIKKNQIGVFIKQGYLSDNNSWFENIEMLPHGSIAMFNLMESSLSIQSYWDFDHVKQRVNCNDTEIVEEMEYLFRQSIRRCMSTNHRYGISVSGGLDSRAILALSHDVNEPVYSYTFGYKGCIDEKIALKVASIRKSNHHFYELSETDWIKPRLEGVWFTDGQVNLMHMHGIEFLGDLKQHFDVELNGFIGDAVLGGSLLGNIPYKFMFLSRIRRFVRALLELSELEYHVRMPFVDNELMQFSLSIQEQLKEKWRLYSAMLLKAAPEYYAAIEWEKIKMPVSMPYNIVALKIFAQKASVKLRSLLHMAPKNSSYSDYPDWLRKNPALDFVKEVLLHNDCICNELDVGRDIALAIKEHLQGKNNAQFICVCLTLELWLQQIFNGKFRKWDR